MTIHMQWFGFANQTINEFKAMTITTECFSKIIFHFLNTENMIFGIETDTSLTTGNKWRQLLNNVTIY